MSFKHSLSILTSRFSITYKLLVFLIVITFLFSVLTVCAVYPTLSDLRNNMNELDLGNAVKGYVREALQGNPEKQAEAYEMLSAKFDQATEIVRNNSLQINLSIVWLVLLYLLYVVFFSWGQYCVSDVINHHMSSNSKFGFSSNLIVNFKKAMRYSLLYTAITIGFMIVVALLYWLSFATLFKVAPLIGLASAVAIFVVAMAVRRALLFGWIPAMVADGLDVVDGLKKAMSLLKQRFSYAFGLYLIYYVSWIGLTIAISLFTFFVGTLFAISVSLALAQACDLVIYYRTVGKRYYIDVLNVVDPSIKQRSI